MPALPTPNDLWEALPLDAQLDFLEKHTLFRRETFDKYRFTEAIMHVLNGFAVFLIYLEPLRKRHDGKTKFLTPELPIMEIGVFCELVKEFDV